MAKSNRPCYDFINFLTVPSLEDMAIVVIASKLWDLTDVSDNMREFIYHLKQKYKCKDDCVCDIVRTVIKKVPDIPLPKSLLEKVSNAIRPMGIQILNWATEYSDAPNTVKIEHPIYWTGHGIIDRARTVESKLYIPNPVDDIEYIYNKACTYCCEDIIRSLWSKMPGKSKKTVFYRKSIYERHQFYLIAYWTCRIESYDLRYKLRTAKSYNYHDVFDMKFSVTRNMLSLSILYCNELAFKHFWRRLSEEEERRSIAKYIRNILQYRRYVGGECYQDTNHYTDIILFLLTRCKDRELQSLVFENESELILDAFFSDWPWQKFLLPTIQEMWGYLDERVYNKLISKLIFEAEPGRMTENVLEELWYMSPEKFQNSFIGYLIISFHQGRSGIWTFLGNIQGAEFRKTILKNLTEEEKKAIILSTFQDDEQMRTLALTSQLGLIDRLISETTLSESEISVLKYDAIEKCWVRLSHICAFHCFWREINGMLSWGFLTQDEREQFKNKPSSLVPVLNSLVFKDEPESVEDFLMWCCSCDEEINQFKEAFAGNRFYIVTEFSAKDWDDFEKVSKSSQSIYSHIDIELFKQKTLEYENITDDILNHHYDFEYMQPIFNNCFERDEEIKQLNGKLMLSKTGIEILRKYTKFDMLHVIANELPAIFLGKKPGQP